LIFAGNFNVRKLSEEHYMQLGTRNFIETGDGHNSAFSNFKQKQNDWNRIIKGSFSNVL
jgi:hypothetical protein